MSERNGSQDKAAVFKLFEASLSNNQRHILLKHPDILSPELISQLYQASLERMSAQHIEQTFSCKDVAIGDGGEGTPKKPRKMVNSWMAFRSYYSTLIKDLPQKVRSPMLALLWKNDVDHGLWELLSAAFSYIRDSHTEDQVSIDQFLLVAAQVVPIIPADQYFTRSGWTRAGDTLKRIKVSPQELSKATNLSCAGVVRYCFRQGLISRPPTIAQADLRPTGNHRAYPSSISFAAAASSPLAYVDSSDSVNQVLTQDQDPVNVGINPFEPSGTRTDYRKEEIDVNGNNSAQSSTIMDLDSGAVNQSDGEIAIGPFSVNQETRLSATAQAGSLSSYESEFWTMSEGFGGGSYALDDFWSPAG